MKKLLVLLLLLVAAFVGLIMAAPLVLDSEKLKADFTNKLEEATGHQVFLDGDFTISVFPKPAFVADKIRILNSEKGKKENLLTAESIEAELDLTSFLFGQAEIKSAVLHKPEIFVEVLPNGDINWMLDAIRLADISRQVVYHDISISFSKIDIVDGKLNFTDTSSGIEHTYTGIDGEFTARTKKGPFRFDGNMDFLGIRSNLAILLEKIEEDAAAPFNVMISSDALSSTMNISGNLLLQSKGFEVKGSISAESSNPVNLLENVFRNVKIPSSLSVATATSMSLLYNNNQLFFRDIVVKQENASAVGNVDIILKPKEDEKYLTSKFMVDNLVLDGLVELTNNILKSPTQKGFTFPLNSFAEVSSGTLKYANHDIKGLKFTIDSDEKSWEVSKASASLMADSNVKLNLTVTKGENDAPATLSGKFAFETENMNEVATWLNIPLLSKARKGSLFSVKLSSAISGSGYNVNLSDMSIKTSNITINGRVGMNLAKPKNIDFDVKINDLDLDRYIPQKATASLSAADKITSSADLVAEKDDSKSLLQIFKEKVYATGDILSGYKDFDIKAKMDIGKFTYNRDQIGHIVIAAGIKNSKLTIDDFTLASRLGGTAAAKGIFDFSDKSNPSFDKFTYNARLVRCTPYLDNLGLNEIFKTNDLSNVKLDGQLNGTVNNLSFVFSADSAGLSIANDGKLSIKANEPPLLRFHTEIRQPQLRSFMSLLKNEYNVPFQINKNIAFSGMVTVKEKNIVIRDVELTIGSDSVRGNFGMLSKDGHNLVNLQLETGELDITEYANMLMPDKKDKKNPKILSDDFFPFISWLKEKDFTFSFAANNVFWREYAFRNLDLKLKSDKGVGNLKFTSNLENGKVQLLSDFDFSLPIPAVSLTSAATNMKISKLFPHNSKWDLSADKADFHFSAKAQGRSMMDMAKTVSMYGKMKLTDGRIKGFSLDKVIDFMERIKDDRYYNPADFSVSFGGIFQNNATSFNTLQGSFSAKGGVIQAPDINVVYRDTMTASINFNYSIPDSKINTLIVVPVLKELNFSNGYNVIVKGVAKEPLYNYRIQGLIKEIEDSIDFAITGVKHTAVTVVEPSQPDELPVSKDVKVSEESFEEPKAEAESENAEESEKKEEVPLIVPMDDTEEVQKEEPVVEQESENVRSLKEKVEQLDALLQKTEEYVFASEKQINSAKSFANVYSEMKKVLSDMKYSFASINDILTKDDITDDDMKKADEAEQNIRKKADLIARAYNKLLLVISVKTVEESASAIADFVVAAKELEKSNPYSTNIGDYVKDIYDADYEVKMSLQKVKTKGITPADAERAAENANRAYIKAKAASDKIKAMSGYVVP